MNDKNITGAEYLPRVSDEKSDTFVWQNWNGTSIKIDMHGDGLLILESIDRRFDSEEENFEIKTFDVERIEKRHTPYLIVKIIKWFEQHNYPLGTIVVYQDYD